MSTEDMNQTEVSFPSSDPSCQLYGDLTLPSPQSQPSAGGNGGSETAPALLPAIVIVNGSGPIDRNGDVPSMRMYLNTSNRFAEHMTASSSRPADRAIAVLSYDKRGVGKSLSMPHDKNFFNSAGMMDFVNDAVEAVRFVSQHPRIDKTKIIVMGHSEGAIIMPLICREVQNAGLDPIFGSIFYAGFGENLLDAMKVQRETIVKEVGEMAGPTGWILRRVITKEKLEKQYEDMMIKVNAPEEPDFITMQCGLSKQPAKWFREHFAYNVNEALEKNITCHCLAITGKKDFQVRNEFCKPETAAKLAPNAKSMESHQLLNLTHALRSIEGEPAMMSIKKDYDRMGKMPLDPEMLAITDAWCDRFLFDGTDRK